MIEHMLHISNTSDFESKSILLIQRIQQATELRIILDKRIYNIKQNISEKQNEITKYYTEIKRALLFINNKNNNTNNNKVIETPLEMITLVASCESSIQESKRLIDQLNQDSTQAILAVNKINISQLDSTTLKEYERLKNDIDILNKKVIKIISHHIRTMTRFDALSGRNDKVIEVAESLNHIIQYAEECLTKALERVVEVEDGGKRCDFEYAEERAKLCEDSVDQVCTGCMSVLYVY